MSNIPPPPPSDPSWNQPPAPAPASVPPPPANFGVPPAPAYGAPMAPAVGELSTKPPRPNVRVGALLMIIGAVVTAICTALPWLKVDGANGNGFDDYFSNRDGELKILQGPGKIWIFFAVVVVGLGIALYLAGRVLAVAIIGIVFAAIGAFFVLGSITIASDNKDLASAAGNDASLQFGLYLGIVGMLVALAGAITATAKRRR